MKFQNINAGFTITVLVVGLIGAVGWIMNVVKLFGMNFEVTGMFVARVVGIFVAPLGGVLGFF